MKLVLLFILLFSLLTEVKPQVIPTGKLNHTYSIVARDPETGEIGVAVQTHAFGVGARVSWAEAGVGAIATQSFTNVSFGPRGLELLRKGYSAREVLEKLIDSDEGREVRQLAVIDNSGNTASWTGDKCIREAGSINDSNFSVQANMMLTNRVWSAMAETFRNSKSPLAERLLETLEAAQSEGGDIRGKQSAALKIVEGNSNGNSWEGISIDLRVDDSENPLLELKRLLRVKRAYQHMNESEAALEKDDYERAEELNKIARTLLPGNPEIKYWYAISLANKGKVEKAVAILKEVYDADKNWIELTRRLPETGLLTVGEEGLKLLLSP